MKAAPIKSDNGSAPSKARNRIATVMAEKDQSVRKHIQIKPPNWKTALFKIVSNAPLVICKFSAEAQQIMHDNMAAGDQTKKGKKRAPKDFQRLYEAAKYVSREGWLGISALSFRNSLISACRTAGFKMTMAKLTVFVVADGYDRDDGTPLVRITKGEPHYFETFARNQSGGTDLRARPMWDEWEAILRIRFDADIFSLEDVANLLMRSGTGGVGNGRPDSSNSAGMGWGTFEVASGEEVRK